MVEMCPFCGSEMHDVFYGNDKMHEGVDCKRCMSCDKVMVYKAEIESKQESE